MYKKKSFADQFNRKKTIQNDLNRLQNVHQKINHNVHIVTSVSTPIKFELSDKNNTIYKFNQNSSTNITFDISRENNDNDKIPSKALEPIAVLREPVVLLQSEPAPNDVLFEPFVV